VRRTHGLSTRHSTNCLIVPNVRLTVFKHSFIYHSIILWNSLPEHLHAAKSLRSFKRMLVQFLLL
jgi:hypothetical protein